MHRAVGTWVLSSLLALLVVGGTACAPEAPGDGFADLVLRGGKVVSLDGEIGEARALAIRGHTIAAVGSEEEIETHVGPDTRVIELDGRLAIPGFVEGHGHWMSLGRAQQILDLGAAANWSEIVEMVAEAAEQAEPGEWIFGRGWHQEKWDEVPSPTVDGVPLNDGLSAVSPDNPVYLGHASGHASFANDAALSAAGIDGSTPDPDGGTIVRAPDGEPTGLLRENAQDIVEAAIEEYEAGLDPDEMERSRREQVRLAGLEALRNGVTSFHDAGTSFETIDFLRTLEEEGSLPVRLYVMVRYESNEEMAERLPDYRMTMEGNDFLTVRSIKRQIDGALGSHGAWLLEPYADMSSSTGLVLEPVAEIERTAEIALDHGFQVNTHAIGTRANREVLDIYERKWRAAGADGPELRWRIEHAQHLHPDDIPRFAELGVIAAMQGIHCTSDGPWIPERLGPERSEITSYRWRDLIDSGAILGNGTDVPVERIDPIASYYASVSRTMNTGQAFHRGQAMTRMEALESYTINNAYLAFEEELKGSLTPGKLADVVVLSQDILTVAEDEIPNTTVDYTIVGGEV
ncbi:MAG: amidohydrolase family protein, partial [Gemmatimonadetes bacterium]|nr:amidohydrolase [Gemmatimonadota bacterium]NIR77468.1 amidohydrolase [Gemmatimonadota bacterium]NIT85992.1 amidohydrolase [Gemmatimonadota bacterium]NIU29812.1 amidohydrolase [Gemmatimonadota bacterium]NIU34834.1 amidohydrolase family protein [Gemmatimonadota bacterium]